MSLIRNKQRLIHLYRYLLENTDEDHQVTTNDLVEFLKKEDANASRKTVKDDIEILIQNTDVGIVAVLKIALHIANAQKFCRVAGN